MIRCSYEQTVQVPVVVQVLLVPTPRSIQLSSIEWPF